MALPLAGVLADQPGTEVWFEPFAGGAGAGLTLLARGDVGEVWLGEVNPALCAFWTAVTREGEWLARKAETFAPTLSSFLAAREALGEAEISPCAGDLDLAWAAFVVNRCSRSGMIGAAVGPIGGMNQSGAWDVASRWNGPALAGRIRWAHEQATSGRLRFLPGDAVTAVERLSGSGIEEEVFVFLDPPYVREGRRLYVNAFDERDHERLARALRSCPSTWLLTYDDEPVVADTYYPDHRVLAFEIPNTANRPRLATEHAVLSHDLYLPQPRSLVPGRRAWWVREHPSTA